MTEQQIKEKAEYLLMYAYEKVNSINCYGITPKKSDSIEYQKAKKRAMRMTKEHSFEIYKYIRINF